MAIKQSPWGAGLRQAPVSDNAGTVVCAKYRMNLTENLAAGDILELGVLPSYHTVVDAILVAPDLGAGVTIEVGIMSGTVGSPDNSRTSGNELFQGTAGNAVTRMSKAAGFQIAPIEGDRSIGVKASGAVTASGQVVELIVQMIQ